MKEQEFVALDTVQINPKKMVSIPLQYNEYKLLLWVQL